MLKSLRIRNYRVFKDLEVSGLKRINLIAGKNNSGKTSLLEAICLLVSHKNPQVAINSHVVRPPAPVDEPGATLLSVETAWKHLFHGVDMTRPIKIDGALTSGLKVNLKISTHREHLARIALASGLTDAVPEARTLKFQYSDSRQRGGESRISVSPNGIEVEQPESDEPDDSPSAVQGVRMMLPQSDSGVEDAALLANLRIHKKSDTLLNALQIIEPRLQSVEDSVASGTPMIWGDVGLSEMIPLRVMGEGMVRVARIVLGIYSMPGGVVLVDEIENGIHHSVMSDVWRVIGKAAEQSNAQVVATTHSFECIEGAVNGLKPDEFGLFRLRINHMRYGAKGDGSNDVVSYDPEMAELAVRRGIEVR